MGEVVLVLECQDIEGKLITSFDNWVVEKASRFFFWEISNWHTPKKTWGALLLILILLTHSTYTVSHVRYLYKLFSLVYFKMAFWPQAKLCWRSKEYFSGPYRRSQSKSKNPTLWMIGYSKMDKFFRVDRYVRGIW